MASPQAIIIAGASFARASASTLLDSDISPNGLAMIVGVLSLAAALYLNHGYWPGIAFVTGLACLVGGVVVLLKRRDARLGGKRSR